MTRAVERIAAGFAAVVIILVVLHFFSARVAGTVDAAFDDLRGRDRWLLDGGPYEKSHVQRRYTEIMQERWHVSFDVYGPREPDEFTLRYIAAYNDAAQFFRRRRFGKDYDVDAYNEAQRDIYQFDVTLEGCVDHGRLLTSRGAYVLQTGEVQDGKYAVISGTTTECRRGTTCKALGIWLKPQSVRYDSTHKCR